MGQEQKRITGTHVYTMLRCPRAVALDLFEDRDRRRPLTEAEEFVRQRGRDWEARLVAELEYPEPEFHGLYTINDECSLNVIDVMLEAHRIYSNPDYLESAKRGGDFLFSPGLLAASFRSSTIPDFGDDSIGFRVAMVPEPGTGMSSMAALGVLLGLTRRSRIG